MPPLPNATRTIKVTVYKSNALTQHVGSNRHFYQWTTGAPATADLLDLATNVYNAYATMFAQTRWTADDTLVEAVAEDISSGSGGQQSYNHLTTPLGSAAAPAQACALITWGFNRRYRGGKPRTFLGGLAASAITNDNQITPQTQGDAQALANNLAGGTGSVLSATYPNMSGLHMVNVSYYQGFTNYTKPSGRESSRPTLRVTPQIDVIDSWVVPLQLATQRRHLKPS